MDDFEDSLNVNHPDLDLSEAMQPFKDEADAAIRALTNGGKLPRTIGLDIAKSVFQVHGVDVAGSVVIRSVLVGQRCWRALASCRVALSGSKRVPQRITGAASFRRLVTRSDSYRRTMSLTWVVGINIALSLGVLGKLLK
jgi:hypothetical protein